jgi:glycosyltransferase involved in cell wall biosynthesis
LKTVSIIIPCRNEEMYIARCINSVLSQDYAAACIDILVCDGMSTDLTRTIVAGYTKKQKNVQILDNFQKTTPFALNLGISNSNSDVVIILGAHSEILPDYVSSCVEILFSSEDIGCVGGIIENRVENFYSNPIAAAMSSPFGVGNASFRTGLKVGYVDTVAFGAYKRSVFNKIGLFDEELVRNQDDEFNFRLIKSSLKIYLSKNIRSIYYVRSSFANLFRQYFQYGYWKVYVNKKHKVITSGRQLAPFFFVLFILLGCIASAFSHLFFFIYCFALFIYIVSAFIMALFTRKANVSLIVYSFFILHFGYGLGYWKGFMDFIIFQKKPSKNQSLSR